MAISMSIMKRSSGISEEIPVATMSAYRSYWKRGAEDLNLGMIDALGALWITPQFRDRFLDELCKLKTWATAHEEEDPNIAEMIVRLDAIVEAIQSHSLDEYEISFG